LRIFKMFHELMNNPVFRRILLKIKICSGKICTENQNKYFILVFFKLCGLWDYEKKYCSARQATDENMAHSHWMLDTKGYKPTLSLYVMLIAFLLQQWLHKRSSLLRYTTIPVLLIMGSEITQENIAYCFIERRCQLSRLNGVSDRGRIV
jgi:hypothetical protein